MSLDKYDKLDILYRNKVIFEDTLADLKDYKEFKKIYVGFVRHPETLEWNIKGILVNRERQIKDLKVVLKRIIENIRFLSGDNRYNPVKSSSFLFERNKLLAIHLNKLRELRKKRKILDGVK